MTNTIARQFSNLVTTQAFLSKYLEHMTQYFQNKQKLSQQKTYKKICQFSQKIQAVYPEFDCLRNMCEKVISNVREKVDDKFVVENENKDKKIDDQYMEEMVKQFARKSSLDEEEKQQRSQKRQVDEEWLRGLLFQEIKLIIEDIKLNQDQFVTSLGDFMKINGFQSSSFNALLLDSALNNEKQVLAAAKQINAKVNISLLQHKYAFQKSESTNKVLLKNVNQHIRQADIIFISAETILRQGGALVPSGGLMVSIAARMYNKPLVILGRSFCLSDKLVLNQSNLLQNQNPLKYFPQVHSQSASKVYVGKRHDFIEPGLIKSVVLQVGYRHPLDLLRVYKEYFCQEC